MKGLSPLVSAVLLIMVTFSLAVIIIPWMIDMALTTTNETGSVIEQKVFCNKLAYDFDSEYGDNGIIYNFTGANGTIKFKLINTGLVNVYDFDAELTFKKEDGSEVIKVYPDVMITAETQRGKTNPLRPGREWIFEFDVFNINANWSLEKVKVLNGVCPSITASLEI